MKEIRTLIVEDEVIIAESIKIHLTEIGFENIRMAHDRQSAELLIDNWNPEIVLLDIHMEKEDDGIYLGMLLQKRHINYMYITANTDNITTKKILGTKPVGFISKPIRFNEFKIHISMLVNLYQPKNEVKILELTNGSEKIQFKENELKYLRSNGNYIEVYLDSSRMVIRNTLDNCLLEIDSQQVIRVHRSYAVSTDRIQKISNHQIFLQDIQIPVSRLYLPKVKEATAR